ncbi:MAG TPA: hypothetical protein VIU15_19605, partial [Streptomyces sp.]
MGPQRPHPGSPPGLSSVGTNAGTPAGAVPVGIVRAGVVPPRQNLHTLPRVHGPGLERLAGRRYRSRAP